jgi:preprotein translocase subunit SecG
MVIQVLGVTFKGYGMNKLLYTALMVVVGLYLLVLIGNAIAPPNMNAFDMAADQIFGDAPGVEGE